MQNRLKNHMKTSEIDLQTKTDTFIAQKGIEGIRQILTREYLDNQKNHEPIIDDSPSLKSLKLLKFTEVRFRKIEDLHTGMQSLLTSVSRSKQPFVFILRRTRDEEKYNIYIGIWPNSHSHELSAQDSFKGIISAVRGFFPGCKVEDIDCASNIDSESKRDIWRKIFNLSECRIITGIPANKNVSKGNSEAGPQKILSIENLCDSCTYPFALIIYADPLDASDIESFRHSTEYWINQIHLYTKNSLQVGQSTQETEGDNISVSYNESASNSDTYTESETKQMQPEHGGKTLINNVKTVIYGGEKPTYQKQESTAQTSQESSGIATTYGENNSISYGQNTNFSIEQIDKSAQEVEKILERHLKRFEEGKGTGCWQCVTIALADNPVHVDEVATLFRGMLSGYASSDDPIRILDVGKITTQNQAKKVAFFQNEAFTHPFAHYSDRAKELTQGIFTQLTTRELSHIVSLPQNELPGIFVEELVEYGRNWLTTDNNDKHSGVDIGKLIDRHYITESNIHLNREKLQRHCFISGATGSGKSTTVKHLLKHLWIDCKIPFLVIEPVKSEYKTLEAELEDNLQFYRLGEDNFSLNPFDFDENLLLTSHLDILKATFNASLGMYSSMPFILEHILYKLYEQYGWNIESGKNKYIKRLKDCGFTNPHLRSLFLPVLGAALTLIPHAIKEFFGETQTDYSGSLKGALHARLSSLIRGSKGKVLNQRSTTHFADFLSKPCIIDLSNFTDNDEKAFLMALLMTRLYEHRQAEERKNKIHTGVLRHVLVIEEAHRLLSKPTGSSEHNAQGRQKGVEVFADILAEIRSYGQGLIVIDQIPSKLVPDVLRNTDIKIAHRIVDKEDRDLLGATMNLDEKQIRELTRFEAGEACVYFSGLRKALRVKIENNSSHSPNKPKQLSVTQNNIPLDFPMGFLRLGAILFDLKQIQHMHEFEIASRHLRQAISIDNEHLLERSWVNLQDDIITIGKSILNVLELNKEDTQAEHDDKALQLCNFIEHIFKYINSLWAADFYAAKNNANHLKENISILHLLTPQFFYSYIEQNHAQRLKNMLKELKNAIEINTKEHEDEVEFTILKNFISFMRGNIHCEAHIYEYYYDSIADLNISEILKTRTYKSNFLLFSYKGLNL